MRCLVLGANPYDFKDEDGARVEGVTIHYCTLDPDPNARSVGVIPLNVSAPARIFHRLEGVPAFYDIEFGQRPGRGGKPTVTVLEVRHLEDVSLGDATNVASE